MSVYKDAKKGHKIAVGKAVNHAVRSHVFDNGWVMEDEDIRKTLDSVLRDYFVRLISDSLDSVVDKIAFRRELVDKITRFYSDFSIQEPTAKQVYYYVHLCLEAGDNPHLLLNNEDIFNEIDRLKKIVEDKGTDRERKSFIY